MVLMAQMVLMVLMAQMARRRRRAGGVFRTISSGSRIVRPIGSSPVDRTNTAAGETMDRGNRWPPENTEPPTGAAPAAVDPNLNRHFTPDYHGRHDLRPAWQCYHAARLGALSLFNRAFDRVCPTTHCAAIATLDGQLDGLLSSRELGS